MYRNNNGEELGDIIICSDCNFETNDMNDMDISWDKIECSTGVTHMGVSVRCPECMNDEFTFKKEED